jgi:oligopeptide transport system permease protein
MHLAAKVGALVSLLFAYVMTGWVGMAARVRMQFYRFKGQEYILAARTLGAKDRRLIFKHIFPNAIGTIITGSVLSIPGVIFSESTLSYLGIISLETSSMTSIGTMLANGQGYLSTFPHIILFPSLFISILMISFNLFGNGLRDAFNPSLRGADE